MNIKVNGEQLQLSDGSPLSELLELLRQPDGTPFAVAVNRAFVPQSQYELTHLQGGDEVEILSPMVGG